MEATPSGTIINFITNTIINLNIEVLVKIFLCSFAATSGILSSNKIIRELIKHLRFKSELKYQNRFKEVCELNRKMHDRLVEFEEVIELDKRPADKLKRRLLYSSSRLGKYNFSIPNDVRNLLSHWEKSLTLKKKLSLKEFTESKVKLSDLIQQTKLKIDTLLAEL